MRWQRKIASFDLLARKVDSFFRSSSTSVKYSAATGCSGRRKAAGISVRQMHSRMPLLHRLSDVHVMRTWNKSRQETDRLMTIFAAPYATSRSCHIKASRVNVAFAKRIAISG
jgi:hypothetical protein